MSSCLNGGAAYRFEMEMMKSPPPSHSTPSPSSTISEESNSSPPFSISTRRPRTPRKRPNQTYDEAVALLSTAYPKIFTFKKTKTQFLATNNKSPLSHYYHEPSQLLLPYESIEDTAFLFNHSIQTISEVSTFGGDNSERTLSGTFEDFDAVSIMDEDTEEGIDSIMGNIESNDGAGDSGFSRISRLEEMITNRYGRFPLGLGLRSALRESNEDEDWWNFPTVELERISPRIQTTTTTAAAAAVGAGQSNVVDNRKNETVVITAVDKKKKRKTKKKKKKRKVAPVAAEVKSSEDPYSNLKPEQSVSLMLKLDYEGVLEAWSDKESPFSDEILGSDAAGLDLYARLGEIDLFGESGLREASVLRYKEKRRNRLFSKKIRYQVRKHSADQRPRMKGRFVRTANERLPLYE